MLVRLEQRTRAAVLPAKHCRRQRSTSTPPQGPGPRTQHLPCLENFAPRLLLDRSSAAAAAAARFVTLCAWRLPSGQICLRERHAWFRTLPSPQRSPRYQVALVTGGGSGIGLEITRQLAAHGARVAICGRRATVVADSVALLRSEGLQVEGTHADVRSPVRLRSKLFGSALKTRCSAGGC